MWFVVAGVLLVAMKLAAFGPVAGWAWWWVLAPFAGAALWWMFADGIGLTKKREMDKMEARKAERRRKNLANLGLYDPKEQRREATSAQVRQRIAEKVEAKRSRIREENEQTVRNSVLDSKQTTGFTDSEPARPPTS